MQKFKDALREEQKRLEEIIAKAKKENEHMPEGNLRISKHKNRCRYYHCVHDRNGIYIPKRNMILREQLAQGLLLDTPIFINMGFAKTANGKNTVLNFANEFKDGKKMLEQLHVKAGSLRDPARSLSGGNQQKVVLAKWLLTNPKVLILDEPTRGIDISAKSEIYTILRQLAADGVCVIVVSSELPEVLGICDRVLVMKDGYFTHEFTDIANLTEEDIMKEASFGNRVDVTSGKGAE